MFIVLVHQERPFVDVALSLTLYMPLATVEPEALVQVWAMAVLEIGH